MHGMLRPSSKAIEIAGEPGEFLIVELTSRYAIADVPPRLAAGGLVIMCRTCGMVSSHPDDVAEKYCGRCREFIGDAHLQNRNGVL